MNLHLIIALFLKFTLISARGNIYEDLEPRVEESDAWDADYNEVSYRPRHSHSAESQIYFPHEKSCRHFYLFEGQDGELLSCRKGQAFNIERSKCEKEKNVDCKGRKKVASSEESKETYTFKCPSRSGNYAHGHYCNMYYHCRDKKSRLMQCKQGELFDANAGSCKKGDRVDCESRRDPNEGSEEITEEPETEEPETEEPKTEKPIEKPKCPRIAGIFPHPTDCDKYITCIVFIPKVSKCPLGTLFDNFWKSCVFYKFANCNNGNTEEPTTTRPPIGEFRCPSKSGNFPDEDKCDAYYNCNNNKHKREKCPKGKLFDVNKGSCEPEDKVKCGDRTHPDRELDDPNDEVVDPNPDYQCKHNHGKEANEDYCHWYYRCHDKKAKLIECGGGRHFDRKQKKCLHPDDTSCDGRIRPEDLETKEPTNVCVGDGNFPHEKNCGLFYKCSKGKAEVKKCPKKQLYDLRRRECDDEERIDCGSRIHPDDNPDGPEDKIIDPKPKFECNSRHGRYKHEQNCDWYYHCKDKIASIRSCRRGWYYDFWRSSCLESWEVDCENRIKPEDREKSTTTPQPTTTEIATLPPFVCPSKDGKYPDDYDCGVYYDCKKGKHKTTYCATGYLYDADKKKCLREDDVDCGSRIHPDDDPNEKPDKIVDENPNVQCKNRHGKFTQDEFCDWYYHCKDMKPTTRECKKGKYYDAEKRRCRNFDEVECKDRKKPDEREKMTTERITTTVSTTTVQEEETTTTTPKIESTTSTTFDVTTPEMPFQCPVANGEFPHPRECRKFYVCTNYTHFEAECPPKQLYDVERKICDEEENVNCGDRIYPGDNNDDKVIDPNPDFNCTTRHGCFTHETFCKWYYHCHDKRPSVRECGEGKYFDSVRFKCENWWMVFCEDRTTDATTKTTLTTTPVTPSAVPTTPPVPEPSTPSQEFEETTPSAHDHQSTTPENPSTTFTCEDDGNYPHPSDCSLYYKCENDVTKLQQCPAGTLFDTVTRACEPEDWVNCEKREKPEPTGTPSVGPTTTEIPIEELCASEDGDFHHPTDCRLFYRCKDGIDELKECPSGTLFDNALRECYDEEKVNCGNRQRPPTTINPCELWHMTSTTPSSVTTPTSSEGTQSPENENTSTPSPETGTPSEPPESFPTGSTVNENGRSTSPNPNEGSSSPNPNEGSSSLNPNEGSSSPNPNEGSSSPNPNEGSTTPNPNEESTENGSETPGPVITENDVVTPSENNSSSTETAHPCLTYTPMYKQPPPFNCAKHDLDCIIRETGEISDWFTCPEEHGIFPHPSSTMLFIHCSNSVPSAKKCAIGLVFSSEFLNCIIPESD